MKGRGGRGGRGEGEGGEGGEREEILKFVSSERSHETEHTDFRGSFDTTLPLMGACLVQHGRVLLCAILMREVVRWMSIRFHQRLDSTTY